MKRQATDCGEIFAKDIFDKELFSKMCKELNTQQYKNLIKNG